MLVAGSKNTYIKRYSLSKSSNGIEKHSNQQNL